MVSVSVGNRGLDLMNQSAWATAGKMDDFTPSSLSVSCFFEQSLSLSLSLSKSSCFFELSLSLSLCLFPALTFELQNERTSVCVCVSVLVVVMSGCVY